MGATEGANWTLRSFCRGLGDVRSSWLAVTTEQSCSMLSGGPRVDVANRFLHRGPPLQSSHPTPCWKQEHRVVEQVDLYVQLQHALGRSERRVLALLAVGCARASGEGVYGVIGRAAESSWSAPFSRAANDRRDILPYVGTVLGGV